MTKELQEKKSRGGFHRVTVGETLSAIGRHYNIPVDQLKRINGIENAHVIHVGQLLALKAEAVCQVQAHFLDAQGRPIAGLRYRIHANGKQHEDITPAHGCSRTIVTESPKDKVEIFIKTLRGQWKLLHRTISGFGNKIINCVSNEIHLYGRTVKDASGHYSHTLHIDHQGKQTFKQATSSTSKTNSKGKKSKKGHIISVTSDGLPDELIEWFKGYTGEQITDAHYQNVANELGVEAALIKAFAEVESHGAGFDDRHRPKILYERHVFAGQDLTNHKYDKDYPDISSKYRYTKGPNKDQAQNRYGNGGIQYGKLMRACGLNKNAGYQACSWGKFQILGYNYDECGYSSIESFVREMCISEVKQLIIFKEFVQSNKKLLKSMKEKNWISMAESYNGAQQTEHNYSGRIEQAYHFHMKKT